MSILNLIKWSFLEVFVDSILRTIFVITLTYYVKPSELGIITLYLIIINISEIFIDTSSRYKILNSEVIEKKLISDEFKSMVSKSVIMIIILIFLGFYLEGEYQTYFYFALLLKLLFKGYNSTIQIYFLANKQGKILSSLNNKALIVSTIISFFFLKYGILALVVLHVSNELFKFLLYLSYRGILDYNLNKFSLSFFSKTTLTETLTFLEVNSDSILIGTNLGSMALGLYNFSSNFSEKIRGLLNSSVSKYIYRIYGESNANITFISENYLKVNYINNLITLPLLGFIYIFIDAFSPFFIKNHWLNSIPLIKIMIMISVVHSLTNNWKLLLRAIKKELIELRISMFQTTFFVIGLYLISFFFEIRQTLLFILLYKSLRFLFSIYILKKHLKINIKKLFFNLSIPVITFTLITIGYSFISLLLDNILSFLIVFFMFSFSIIYHRNKLFRND